MLFNYLKIAIRNLSKHKLHTIINVTGLAFGIASVMLILMYLQGELQYDRFHEGAENIYRITWEDDNPQTRTPHPMAQALVQDFPEVESAVSLTPLWGPGLTRETHSFRNLEKDERYDETSILAVDTTFFDVFTFPLVKGNPRTALKHVNGLLISESMARKYFGDEDALGKHLAADSDTLLLEVVGVFKDVPKHSHFHFDFLVSYVREKSFDPDGVYWSWADFGHFNYIRLKPGTDARALEEKLMSWLKKYVDWPENSLEFFAASKYGFRVQPVTDIHLRSRLRWELEPNGNINYIYILATAALFTLIIACVNFMNLTTARSTERAKEIGIRKSLGALRRQLSFQFLSESIVTALLSIVLSIFIIEVTLPFFNAVSGFSFEIDYRQYIFVLVILGLLIGTLSGLYPALYLSRVEPHLILKGRFMSAPAGNGLRTALIVFQFTISMALISGSVIIFNQLDFLNNKELGFKKEGVLVIPLKNEALRPQFDALRNELLNIADVKAVSGASNIPGRQFNQNPITASSDVQHNIASSEAFVGYDFFDVMGMELKEGRFFMRENPADSSSVAFVINETAAHQLNLSSPVGEEIRWDVGDTILRGQVIGVMKDFHFQSLHEPIRPLLFVLYNNFNFLLIRMEAENFNTTVAAIENTYRKFDSIFAFEFQFLEDQLQQQYSTENKMAGIFSAFTFIAIAIACFGLFGMAMLTFRQKTKEVSIRKVLGAPLLSLLTLLLGNFTKLIIVSILLATPLAWWTMSNWLNNFSYRITIHPGIFIASGLALVVIAWITLGYLTVKTTQLNPAETLKNE